MPAIHISRIFRPAPGKAELLKTLITAFVKRVERKEVNVLKYQVYCTQSSVFVSQEMYKNATAALDHMKTKYFFDFYTKLAEENVLETEVETMIFEHIVGYEDPPEPETPEAELSDIEESEGSGPETSHPEVTQTEVSQTEITRPESPHPISLAQMSESDLSRGLSVS